MRQAQVLPLLAATSIVVLCVYFALRSKSSIERDDSSSNDESSLGEKKDMTSTIEEEHDRSPKIEEKINTPNESINGAMKKEEEASMINNDEIEEKVQLQNQNQIHKNDSQNDDSNKDEEEEKKSPNVKKNDIPVLIAYGSQSGNATCIAQDVYEKLSDKGINCNLSDLNSWKKWPTKLEDTKFAVFVISTTGNGDAPDNCDKFQRYIKKKDIPEKFLTNLSCCVLGLGDTNYDKFCEVAQWLQRRLVALDAKFLMKIALADDATGLEDVVEPWLEEVVPIIEDAVDGKLPTNMIKTKKCS
jgi:sulfite reductase alpha subunit-like flavoprotein